MDRYDSDTSSEGGGDDIQTNVTLGYATIESTGDDVSRVGGHPKFITESAKPPGEFAKCKICNTHLSLLLELQADLQEQFPGDERRLYIWCCRKKQCSRKPGSIRAFRETKKAKTSRRAEKSPSVLKDEPAAPVQDLGSQLFGSGPAPTSGAKKNPFSLAGNQPLAQSNPFSTDFSVLAAKPPQTPSQSVDPPTQTFAEKLKISSPSESLPPSTAEHWPAESSFHQPFPHFNLAPEPEYLERITEAPSAALGSNIANGTSSSDTPEHDSKDTFESSMDKTFQLFSDTISQNPEQVLRYDFRGTPLLYNSIDDVATRFHVPHGKTGPIRGIPRCDRCGAARVFELQLVPGLIYEVEKEDETAMDLDSGEGMVWGTIIVGVCERNCGVEGAIVFREEWVGVQWEEGLVTK